ncbi:MAG: immunoglobulin-like domain-containing protein, partial [Acholeplasmataceae bacterium]
MRKFVLFVTVLFAGLLLFGCDESGDNIRPVITVPSATRQIYVGDEFDPLEDVTAVDNVDGDIKSKLEIVGEVDTTKPGVYVLTYKVKDKAGNRALEKTVTVTVLGTPSLANLVNGDFMAGMEGWESWVNDTQDVTANVSVDNGQAVIVLEEQSIILDNNWWDVQLKQIGLTFDRFESFTLKFTAYALEERYMMVNLQGGGLIEKPINDNLIKLSIEPVTYEIDFYGKTDANNAELQFAFGTFHKVEGVEEELANVMTTVYISNVEVIEGPELENQAPMIEGVKPLIAPVGGEVLIKQGLRVVDDFDILTIEDIVATPVGEPVDFDVPGVYTYKYTVEDSKGLEAVAYRDIHVGSFNIPKFEKWEAWHSDAEVDHAEQTVTIEDGVAIIDVTKVGALAFHNQFKVVNLMGLMGIYEIKFKASSSEARTIVLALEQDYGVGVPRVWHKVDLTPELTEYTFELILPGNATSAGAMAFYFGDASGEVDEELQAGTYVASEITIQDFEVNNMESIFDTWEMWHSDAEVDHADQKVTLGSNSVTIDVIKVGALAFHNQFKLTGLMPLKGTYEIKFEASSSEPRTIVLALEQDYGVGVERIWHKIDLTPELTEYTFELVLPGDATSAGTIAFFLGNAAHEPGFEEGTYVPSKIVIENFEFNLEESIFSNWTIWHSDAEIDHADQKVTLGENVAKIEIIEVGALAFHNQFKIEGLKPLEGTYEIKFEASSSVARSIVLALEQNYGVGVPRKWHKIDLTPELTEYAFELIIPHDATETGAIAFFLGDASGETNPELQEGTYVASTIIIRDYSFTRIGDAPIEDIEPYEVPPFSEWESNAGGDGQQELTVEGDTAIIEVITVAGFSWDNKFSVGNFKPVAG